MSFEFKTDVDNFIKVLQTYNLSIGQLRDVESIDNELNRLLFLKACEYRVQGSSWSETEAKLRKNFSTSSK